MNIGIDLDDCIAEFLKNFCIFHNKKYDAKFKLKDFWTYKLWKVVNNTQEQIADRVAEFYKTNFFDKIKPWQDSQKAVFELAKNTDINFYIITSRFGAFKKTFQWLDEYFPNIFPEQNVFFTSNTYVNRGKPITKSELCRTIPLDYLVEDSPEYTEQCHNLTRCVLLDRPWNQRKLPENIIRAYSWRDVPCYIEQKREK